jgi:hypothetical protein
VLHFAAATVIRTVMTNNPREAVGRCYDPALMKLARERSWAALQGIRERMLPGIGEEQAGIMATEVFQKLGHERIWHPTLIRIGANTTKTYRQKSDPDVRRQLFHRPRPGVRRS